jgi:sugar-specific transcriptional regulator TrmB
MIEEILQEIGLNRREILCYISLLELGPSKVGEILKRTGIPSSKIYEILDRLIKKGLVSYIIRDKIKYFQPSNPNFLLDYINEKRKKVESIIPQLLSKQKSFKKQIAEIYEGKKAVFSLFLDLIRDAKPKELYLSFSINEENKDESANLFFRNLTLRRKEKKLDVRLLKNIKYHKKEKHTKLALRYTDFNLPQGITIFKSSVVILSWDKIPLAVKIESEIISKQFRGFFLELWKLARK